MTGLSAGAEQLGLSEARKQTAKQGLPRTCMHE